MRTRVRVVGVYFIWAAMATALTALPAAAAQEGHFDRTLSVTGAVDLSVQTGSGNISVKPGDSSKVEVHATIRADHSWLNGDASARIHDIETNPPIEQNGNTIRIGHFDDRGREHGISISYEVTVPEQTKLHSESGSGDETIGGIVGPVDVTSGSGDLRVANIGGEVHARTGSGERGTRFDQGRRARDFWQRFDSRAGNCGRFECFERQRRSEAGTDGGR